jgi:hypothetical protein
MFAREEEEDPDCRDEIVMSEKREEGSGKDGVGWKGSTAWLSVVTSEGEGRRWAVGVLLVMIKG